MKKTLSHPKPIIGIAGGIGSGKSFVANVFRELGCGVIDADAQSREAIDTSEVKLAIRENFGDDVFSSDGAVNRKALAQQVFTDPKKRKILENIIHPVIASQRLAQTTRMMNDSTIQAVVWDAPLLFEVGLDQECDAVVFVDAPLETRLRRVQKRGWTAQELEKREKSQIPLDKKRELADYIVNNGDDSEICRRHIQQVFSQIIVLSRT